MAGLRDELFPAEQSKILHALIERIVVRPDGIAINWNPQGMNKLLRDTLAVPALEAT